MNFLFVSFVGLVMLYFVYEEIRDAVRDTGKKEK